MGVGVIGSSTSAVLEVGVGVVPITVAEGVDVGACEGRTIVGLMVVGCGGFTVTTEGVCIGLGGRSTEVGLKVTLCVGAMVAVGGSGASARGGVQEAKRVSSRRQRWKEGSFQVPLCVFMPTLSIG